MTAQAESPIPPEKAEVVFSNGGRIVSMKVDGSERTVLTRRAAPVKNTSLGDRYPEISPDGQRIVFIRISGGDDPGFGANTVMVASADGRGVTELKLSSGHSYRHATWMPDGRVLVSRTGGSARRPQSSLVAVDPVNGTQQVIYSLKPVKDRIGRFPALEISRPSVSPDGSRIMFALDDADFPGDPARLQVLDIATGDRQLIDRFGAEGSWAPDGLRVVYTRFSLTRDAGEVCPADGSRCSNTRHLAIARADGSNRRRLTPGRGDARSPDWSADGTHIVFQGNRNMPESAEAYESYSITPAGKCLTWLTNGAPASLDPSWSGDGGQDTYAGGCGSRGLKPLQEIPGLQPKKGLLNFWLGKQAGWRLYSGRNTSIGVFGASYSDCSLYRPRGCGSAFETFTIPVCALKGRFARTGVGTIGWKQRRGLPHLVSRGDGSRFDLLYSGKSLFYMFGEDSRSNAQANESFRFVQVVGKPRSAGLPTIRIPRQDLRRMKKVKRAVRRTGSLEAAARRLGISKKLVRQNLAMSGFVKRFAPVRPVKCPER